MSWISPLPLPRRDQSASCPAPPQRPRAESATRSRTERDERERGGENDGLKQARPAGLLSPYDDVDLLLTMIACFFLSSPAVWRLGRGRRQGKGNGKDDQYIQYGKAFVCCWRAWRAWSLPERRWWWRSRFLAVQPRLLPLQMLRRPRPTRRPSRSSGRGREGEAEGDGAGEGSGSGADGGAKAERRVRRGEGGTVKAKAAASAAAAGQTPGETEYVNWIYGQW